jgi:hypothetical protein
MATSGATKTHRRLARAPTRAPHRENWLDFSRMKIQPVENWLDFSTIENPTSRKLVGWLDFSSCAFFVSGHPLSEEAR